MRFPADIHHDILLVAVPAVDGTALVEVVASAVLAAVLVEAGGISGEEVVVASADSSEAAEAAGSAVEVAVGVEVEAMAGVEVEVEAAEPGLGPTGSGHCSLLFLLLSLYLSLFLFHLSLLLSGTALLLLLSPDLVTFHLFLGVLLLCQAEQTFGADGDVAAGSPEQSLVAPLPVPACSSLSSASSSPASPLL